MLNGNEISTNFFLDNFLMTTTRKCSDLRKEKKRFEFLILFTIYIYFIFFLKLRYLFIFDRIRTPIIYLFFLRYSHRSIVGRRTDDAAICVYHRCTTPKIMKINISHRIECQVIRFCFPFLSQYLYTYLKLPMKSPMRPGIFNNTTKSRAYFMVIFALHINIIHPDNASFILFMFGNF